MATRRNRIKGIANIPQRRKVENKKEEVNVESAESTAQKDGASESNPSENLESEIHTIDNACKNTEIVNPNDDDAALHKENVNVINLPNEKGASLEPVEPVSQPVPAASLDIASPIVSEPCNESDVQNISKPSNDNLNISTSQTNPRRTFIKPKINLKSLQKTKPKLSKNDLTTDVKEPPVTTAKDDEAVCNSQPDVQILRITNNQTSDSENITEPPSPTKLLNRSRIKAVPRLHQRRISGTIHGSASESEDDTRKTYKRVKTDSICSTTSSTCEPPAKNLPDVPPPQSKDSSSVVPRKCKRSEQSSKMAEARRNFHSKFRNQTPEKQKLTMYDLIFYNPATKPMTQKSDQCDKRSDDDRPIVPPQYDSPNKDVESDDNEIPAPQIKIGKNGEIIIDEKSLIVENKQTKQNRESLKKSELVNGDFDTGYGVYKKVKRSKDWSKEETLFFYKALHTLGTDFSLMVQLFPGRTRRELKMKFKKEDRVNHTLIDKALSQPLQFNIQELKEEVERKRKMKELEEHQKQKRDKELEQRHKNTDIPYSYFRIKRTKEKHKRKLSDNNEDLYSKLEKGIDSICNSNSEGDNNSSDSSSEITVSNILKQTRYGRIPNRKKSVRESTDSLTTQSEDLEPGSVMITCKPTSKGEPTFKVFMVTPTHSKVPIDFPSDVINTFTKNMQVAERTVNDENVMENNYTICHDDESGVTEKAVDSENISENNYTVYHEEESGVRSTNEVEVG